MFLLKINAVIFSWTEVFQSFRVLFLSQITTGDGRVPARHFFQRKSGGGREREQMDPNSVKSAFSNLALGQVMAAAARDLQKAVYNDGNESCTDLAGWQSSQFKLVTR
ncbi:hypothetical protein Nepgr_001695 [Nepenthes gracilis]|uniref:Uncharacterized protein n=1 Tax=Nepenthes gracilis TaxID=150966 RepID=A0AAD3RXP6_NEPGR|nr:hypothetical protein Nepgr_001695 [Nepenthes gracilis]